MLWKCGLCRHAVSARLSRLWILSKRVIVSSTFYTIQVFLYQTSWQYSDGNPLTGASNAGGVGTNRDSGWIAGYWLMTAVVCDPQVRLSTVQFIAQAVMHKWMNLCLSQPAACMTTTKRREENRIYLYSAVNLKRNLHSAFCTTEVWVLTDTKHRVAPLR